MVQRSRVISYLVLFACSVTNNFCMFKKKRRKKSSAYIVKKDWFSAQPLVIALDNLYKDAHDPTKELKTAQKFQKRLMKDLRKIVRKNN